jgi:Putative metallopeptidase domain
MAFNSEEILKKRKTLPPEKQGTFDELVAAVDFNLIYAKHILTYTRTGGRGWWLGYRGSLMGTPILTTDPDIPTACVALDPISGKINYYFNLYFAASLSPGDVAFVMAHECLHLVLGHLEQMGIYHIQYPELWNVVTDAFINEYLHRALNWTVTARDMDKLDWTLSNGIRWTDLPQEVQDKYPVNETRGQIEVTSIQIYDEFITYLEKEGIDPNKFEQAVEEKRYGRNIKRRKRIEENKRGSGEKGETIYERVYVEPGDLVFIKSKSKYGLIKDLRRTRDQKGEADIDCDNTISLDDYRRLNRAIGITAAMKKKSYPLSRKIVDAYAKLVASGQALPSWDDLARATGVKEIASLTQIDAAQAAYDEETIMSPEEIEAEELRKEQELLKRAKSFAER